MKTVGEDTFYMNCLPPNERTNERTNDRHRPMAIALGDFVTWAKKELKEEIIFLYMSVPTTTTLAQINTTFNINV